MCVQAVAQRWRHTRPLARCLHVSLCSAQACATPAWQKAPLSMATGTGRRHVDLRCKGSMALWELFLRNRMGPAGQAAPRFRPGLMTSRRSLPAGTPFLRPPRSKTPRWRGRSTAAAGSACSWTARTCATTVGRGAHSAVCARWLDNGMGRGCALRAPWPAAVRCLGGVRLAASGSYAAGPSHAQALW